MIEKQADKSVPEQASAAQPRHVRQPSSEVAAALA